jgi:membrane-associated protein
MRMNRALSVVLMEMMWPAFTRLNVSSVLLWTGFWVDAGYYFGAVIERAVAQGWGALSILRLLIFVGFAVVCWWRLSRAVG